VKPGRIRRTHLSGLYGLSQSGTRRTCAVFARMCDTSQSRRRLVVISFHFLEDLIVKSISCVIWPRATAARNVPDPRQPKCRKAGCIWSAGRCAGPGRSCQANPRAHSAVMRVAERGDVRSSGHLECVAAGSGGDVGAERGHSQHKARKLFIKLQNGQRASASRWTWNGGRCNWKTKHLGYSPRVEKLRRNSCKCNCPKTGSSIIRVEPDGRANRQP